MSEREEAMQASLAVWHRCVIAKEPAGLREIIAEDAVFRSPVLWKPKVGRDLVIIVLKAATAVFEDFTYHRTLKDDTSVVLEFSAHVGEMQLKGIDLIRFDEHGKITELEVMVRPAKGLQALGEAMARQMAVHGDLETFMRG